MSTTQQIKLQSYTKAETLEEPYKTESHGPVVHKQENLINIVLEKLFYNNKKKKIHISRRPGHYSDEISDCSTCNNKREKIIKKAHAPLYFQKYMQLHDIS